MAGDPANELRSPAAVRGHYREPHPLALRKEMRRLDDHCRGFIALAPFLVIATSGADGRADASPRGDAPGFVAVVDDVTLLIPDRRGNNRVDTMMNLSENPHVGLLFMVPGMSETLRVNGCAAITVEAELLAPLAVGGKLPQAAIRVAVEEVYFQCGKALVRSELWNSERHVAPGTLAPFGKVLSDAAKLTYDPDLEGHLEEDYRSALC